MQLRDYILLRKGFRNKRIYEQRLARRITAIIVSCWATKPVNWYTVFPIEGDDELKLQINKHLDEVTRQILEMHKVGGFEYVDEIVNGKRVIVQKQILN